MESLNTFTTLYRMVETYSQILYLLSWESQQHKHSIMVTGYQGFTMKRKSYKVKKTNYSLGKQAGRSIPYLATMKQSALAHFLLKREKKEGFPFGRIRRK